MNQQQSHKPAISILSPSRRKFLKSCAAMLTVSAMCKVAGAAPPVLRNYVGTYHARGRRGTVMIQLVEALPSGSGYISWATIDGLDYLGNTFINNDAIAIQWYHPSGNYQIPYGTIEGTLSADGTSITGPFRHGLKQGTCRLTAN